LAEVGPEALRRFEALLAEQTAQADQLPREEYLPRDSSLVHKARTSMVIEAQRSWRSHSTTRLHDMDAEGYCSNSRLPNNPAGWLAEVGAVLVEIPLESPDGLLRGRIDRAERTVRGIRLVDYKAVVREDLPGRYERQLQLYAYLWHAVTGEWPIEAVVIYPFLTVQHAVPIGPEICQQVALDSAEVLATLTLTARMDDLATPGDVCRVCDYRPWCRPFWRSQQATALTEEVRQRAAVGFEAQVVSTHHGDNQLRLVLRWAGTVAQLLLPLSRFPHLATEQPGAHLRVLDTRLSGQLHAPTVSVTDFSEIYIVSGGEA